jgi:hypothetical protein
VRARKNLVVFIQKFQICVQGIWLLSGICHIHYNHVVTYRLVYPKQHVNTMVYHRLRNTNQNITHEFGLPPMSHGHMIIDVHYKKATIPGGFFWTTQAAAVCKNIFVGGWALPVPGK